jgi:hypothetical protein
MVVSTVLFTYLNIYIYNLLCETNSCFIFITSDFTDCNLDNVLLPQEQLTGVPDDIFVSVFRNFLQTLVNKCRRMIPDGLSKNWLEDLTDVLAERFAAEKTPRLDNLFLSGRLPELLHLQNYYL